MVTRAIHGALRRNQAWPTLKGAHAALSPATCALIHRVVDRVGVSVFTADTVLKHRYDYMPIEVAPEAITRTLKVSAWRRLPSANDGSPRDRARTWWQHGGGWKSSQRHASRTFHGRFVVEGGWDLPASPFQDRSIIRQLFEEGREPAETDEYQLLATRIRDQNLVHAHGCRTMQELDQYFEEMIGAYYSIRDHGYQTQSELGGDPGDEIRVCVTRGGQLAVFGGGTHRLTMVRSLGLERVPVLIKRVHADWAGVTAHDSRREVVAKVVTAIAGLTPA